MIFLDVNQQEFLVMINVEVICFFLVNFDNFIELIVLIGFVVSCNKYFYFFI